MVGGEGAPCTPFSTVLIRNGIMQARYKVHKLIFNKNKYYFENKLNECIGKPKKLLKGLKPLGLPKISPCEVNALKVNKTVQHYTN